MPRKPASAAAPALTTAQSLGSLIKSARDIMRKDKGLNGDLDRLPMLTWIMFLKFLDDLEQQRETEAKLAGKKFKPAIEPPYRWRDWAADPQGVTGDELLSFINYEECTRPDGKKGAGLFAYLRGLTNSNGDSRRDVIATVFKGVDNRMKSGYLLREVINKIAGIHFTSHDELHTLGALYESMLREMRDAAGDSGEFYTPRAVVRFMVEVTHPRLGEVAQDAPLLLASERRIGEDHVHAVFFADLGQLEAQGIAGINLWRIESVQKEVHLAKEIRQGLGFAAEQRLLL